MELIKIQMKLKKIYVWHHMKLIKIFLWNQKEHNYSLLESNWSNKKSLMASYESKDSNMESNGTYKYLLMVSNETFKGSFMESNCKKSYPMSFALKSFWKLLILRQWGHLWEITFCSCYECNVVFLEENVNEHHFQIDLMKVSSHQRILKLTTSSQGENIMTPSVD